LDFAGARLRRFCRRRWPAYPIGRFAVGDSVRYTEQHRFAVSAARTGSAPDRFSEDLAIA
jgi:hypothetical protein